MKRTSYTLLLVALMAASASAMPITIDDFSTGTLTSGAPLIDSDTADSTGAPFASNFQSTLTEAGTVTVGGKRFVGVDLTAGSAVAGLGPLVALDTSTGAANVGTAGSGIVYDLGLGYGTTATAGAIGDIEIDANGLIGNPGTTLISFDIGSGSITSAVVTIVDGSLSATYTFGALGAGTHDTVTLDQFTGTLTDFTEVDDINFVFTASGSLLVDNLLVNTTLPEPNSLAILGAMCGLGLVARRRNRR